MIATVCKTEEEKKFVSKIVGMKNLFDSNTNVAFIDVNRTNEIPIQIHKARLICFEAINEILKFIDVYSLIDEEDAKGVFFRSFFERNLGVIKRYIPGNEKKIEPEVRLNNLLATIELVRDIFYSLIIQTIESTFSSERENPKMVLFYVLASNCHIISSSVSDKSKETQSTIKTNIDSVREEINRGTFNRKKIKKVDNDGKIDDATKEAMEQFLK